MQFVKVTELAEWLSVSRQTIWTLTKRGIIEKTPKGYDLKASVVRYLDHLREVAAVRGGENQILDLTQQRARQAKEQADNLAIKNDQLRNVLIHVDDVAAQWEDITSRVRTGLLAIPARVAHRHSIDQDLLVAIDREIRDSLDELASSGDGEAEGSPGASSADETEA